MGLLSREIPGGFTVRETLRTVRLQGILTPLTCGVVRIRVTCAVEAHRGFLTP